MYVIVDIEWIEKENGEYCPTQLAAVRTDNNGECVENFFEFIRPRSLERCNRPINTDDRETENNFIRAQSLRDAFSDFLSWLADEDILMFRHSGSQEVYKKTIFTLFGRRATHRMLCAARCVSGSLVS